MPDPKGKRSDQLIVSASQLETFHGVCKRKWWMEKVAKLPVPKVHHTTFGDVLHEVAHRWFSADDNGYDPKTGKPVELYPEGWMRPTSKWKDEGQKSLTLEEQSLIKRFVKAAISQGVWKRVKGVASESDFRFKVTRKEGIDVVIMGFIDVKSPMRIEDHKTAKAVKWCKSSNALKTALPMLVYAYSMIRDREMVGEVVDIDDLITLKHNQFVKDLQDPKVREAETEVTVEHVKEFWNDTVIPLAEEMAMYRKKAKDFSDIPHCEDVFKGCNAYGGCPFLRICSGDITVGRYIERHNRIHNLDSKSAIESEPKNRPRKRIANTKTKNSMSLLEKLKQQKAVKGKGEKSDPSKSGGRRMPPLNGGSGTPKVKEAKREESEEVGRAAVPPWTANSGKGCNSCVKNDVPGFNSNGEPCMICLNQMQKKCGMTIDYFQSEIDDEGTITYRLNDSCKSDNHPIFEKIREGVFVSDIPDDIQVRKDEGGSEEQKSSAKSGKSGKPRLPSKSNSSKAKGSERGETDTDGESAEAIVNAEERPPSDEESDVNIDTKGRGRPAYSFKLFVNVAISKCPNVRRNSGRYVHSGEDLLHLAKQAIVQEYNESVRDGDAVEHFAQLPDVWVARNALEVWTETKLAPKLASERDVVVFTNVSRGMNDENVMINVLKRHAETVGFGII